MTGWSLGIRGSLFAVSLGLLIACGTNGSTSRDGDPPEEGDGGESGTGNGSDGGTGGGQAGSAAGTAGSAVGGDTASGGSTANGGDTGEVAGEGGEDAGGAPSGGDSGSDAGGSAGAGMAGTGGSPIPASPIIRIRENATEKIDILFVIDNSISMADKQRIMAEAVPVLLARLVTPRCVDENGDPTGAVATSTGTCASGAPEFPPVKDIHVGIITTSLGDHGSADVCSEATDGRTPNDRAQLLGSVRTGIPGNASGFLSWQPGQDTTAFGADFAAQVAAAGELGCGYESSLESWYRFLIDPDPVASMTNDALNSVRGERNEVLLAQRAEFLRPDSLLAIVMLTDENDCSILDENQTQGWLVSFKGGVTMNNWRMPAATQSCADANSVCCRACIMPARAGCPDNAAESCPESGYLVIANDSMNQRCFQQKRRFGIDLLYPTNRYSTGLRDPLIDPRLDGNPVQNPLFAPEGNLPGRARDMVYLAGIMGVPWQDIATEPSLTDPRKLRYLSARDLWESDRWSVILGNPGANMLPTDPLMRESIDPRPTGTPHPLVADAAVVAPGDTSQVNPINGREQVVDPGSRDDLQFACIFPLAEPVPCSIDNASGCDCNAEESVKASPICSYPTPLADGIQVSAKAYPALRQLEVLRDIGDQALVASICPKNIGAEGDPVQDPDYGYNPAIGGILDRLREGLGPSCIERDLPTESTADGEHTTCSVVEAHRAGSCECEDALGRIEIDSDGATALNVIAQLEADRQCGGSTGIDCDSFCMCEIRQLVGDDLAACQNDVEDPGNGYGFCFIDADSGNVNPAIVRSCPGYAKRALRFTGHGVVNDGAFALLVCPN